ncbi:sensor domain-containing protein, partial [Streptomyces huiliensis]|uniref:sensor domain-containing protein n=1 Tax=Streptomyces huiliensis TaxID=2876027 RepID=UPI001CC014C1
MTARTPTPIPARPRPRVPDPSGKGSEDEPLPPARLAFDAWTWKEVLYLLTNLLTGLAAFTYVSLWLFAGVVLSFTVVGLPLLAVGLMGVRYVGRMERSRARALLGVRIDEPSPPPHAGSRRGAVGWVWRTLKDTVAWRTTLYALIRLPWGVLTFGVTLCALFVAWPVLGHLARGMATVDRAMARGLLCPSDELERR